MDHSRDHGQRHINVEYSTEAIESLAAPSQTLWRRSGASIAIVHPSSRLSHQYVLNTGTKLTFQESHEQKNPPYLKACNGRSNGTLLSRVAATI